MSAPEERCEVCDRPDGYENNPHLEGVSDGCEYPCCTSLCWGGHQCESARVDWRARAIAAEAALARVLTATLREVNTEDQEALRRHG